MSMGPKVAETPLELLTNDLSREEPYMNKIWGGTLFGVCTFAGVCFANYATKRPVFSGIHRMVILTAGAAALGQYIDNYRKGYLAERDAVFRHYIELHPEDFPPFERKKYSELFEPWVPIR